MTETSLTTTTTPPTAFAPAYNPAIFQWESGPGPRPLKSCDRTAKVFYHASCADGFCAAWLMSIALERETDRFYPIQYGISLDDFRLIAGEINTQEDIIFVDFCPPPEIIEYLDYYTMTNYLIIDHHISQKEITENSQRAHYFDGKSGARLTLEYLMFACSTFPHRYQRETGDARLLVNPNFIPDPVRYTEDRDLWKWELTNSREYSAGLQLHEFQFSTWDWIATHTEDIIGVGEIALNVKDRYVQDICDKAALVNWGFPVPLVNSTYCTSEVGEELLRRYPDSPFAAIYFTKPDYSVVFSLRSRQNEHNPDWPGGYDVSRLAQHMSGGGHRNAAGFHSDLAFLQTLIPHV